MICSVVKRETLEAAIAGEREIRFGRKPHWEARCTPLHRSVMLICGGQVRCFRVERVEPEADGFRVLLAGPYTWPRQQRLFAGGDKSDEG